MKERKYRHRTPGLGLPVPGFGHGLLPSVEMRKWMVVENLLMAAMRGMESCVFKEGSLTVQKTDESYDAVMAISKGGKSLTGIAGGAYFECRGKVKWEGLKKGSKYFLYIVANARTFEDPRKVRMVASKYRKPVSSALVAVVDLKGDKPAVDMEPEGKLTPQMLEKHMAVSRNPHGKLMLQDELAVKKLAVVESLEVDESGPISKEGLREAASISWQTQRIRTKGTNGVVVKFSGVVRNAMASLEAKPDVGGDVWFGYHGFDEAAESDKEVVVYSKDYDVTLRVSALCER